MLSSLKSGFATVVSTQSQYRPALHISVEQRYVDSSIQVLKASGHLCASVTEYYIICSMFQTESVVSWIGLHTCRTWRLSSNESLPAVALYRSEDASHPAHGQQMPHSLTWSCAGLQPAAGCNPGHPLPTPAATNLSARQGIGCGGVGDGRGGGARNMP
jgi:hypothetical protein